MDPFQADDHERPSGYLDGPVSAFLAKLADPSPEPAGGAALALTLAMAASLVSLVAGASLARATDPGWRDALSDCRSEAVDLRERAQSLIDADVAAYRRVMRAYALPAHAEGQGAARRATLDAALAAATDLPLVVAEGALRVMDLSAVLTLDAGSPLGGDLAASRALAEGAAVGALETARVNIAAVADRTMVASLEHRLQSAAARLAEGCGGGPVG